MCKFLTKMKIVVLSSILLVSSIMVSQSKMSSNLSTKDSVVIEWNKEKYMISQDKIDSLSRLMLSRFSIMISDKQNQAELKSNMNQLEGMLNKTLEILFDDKAQLKKAKSEMHQAFQDVNPKIDSVIISMQKGY